MPATCRRPTCACCGARGEWQVAKSQTELVAKMHAAVGQLPGQTTWFTQPIEQRINEMVSGVRSDVAVKLFGDDFDTLVAQARRLEATLAAIPGCQDLAVEQIQGQPGLRIKVKQDQIARYGLPVDRVLDVVEAVGSKPLGEVIEGQRRVPLVARLPEALCQNAAQLANVILLTPSGERLTLDQLAKVEKTFGPKMISRESGRRRITVQCNVRGRDVGSFVADAQRAVHDQIELPSGYWLQWGGQFENIERAQHRLMLVVPLSLALITGLLFLAYRTTGDTLVVLASVPIACAGGVIALALREMPLSISATVGFITLSGVSVLNSMVILSAVRLRTAAGMPIAAAIFRGDDDPSAHRDDDDLGGQCRLCADGVFRRGRRGSAAAAGHGRDWRSPEQHPPDPAHAAGPICRDPPAVACLGACCNAWHSGSGRQAEQSATLTAVT